MYIIEQLYNKGFLFCCTSSDKIVLSELLFSIQLIVRFYKSKHNLILTKGVLVTPL